MEVKLRSITGLKNALESLFISNRNEAKFEDISKLWDKESKTKQELEELDGYMRTLFKWGLKHPTMLRFINITFKVNGLHRGAQDDLDAHAYRMHNKIIRSSTRMNKFDVQVSDWYKDKILFPEQVLDLPENITFNSKDYVKTPYGYVLKELSNDKDVLRGLYPLGIPSNCLFEMCLPEFAHMYSQRYKLTAAAPELKDAVEMMLELTNEKLPPVDREYLLELNKY